MIRTLKNTIDKTIIDSDNVTIVYFALNTIVENRGARPNKLDIYGAGSNTTIDWGDGEVTNGSTETIITGPITHRYDEDFVKYSTVENPTRVTIIGPLINISKVYGPGRGFFDKSLVKIDLLTKNINSAYSLFFGCYLLKTVPENIFANCNFDPSAMENCFTLTFGFTGLTAVPKRLFDFIPENACFNNTFSFCEDLTVVDLEFNGPNSKTFKTFNRMFRDCKNLRDLNPNIFKNVNPDSSFVETFCRCRSILITDDIFKNITNGRFTLTFKESFEIDDLLKKPVRPNTLGLNEKRLPDKLCQNVKDRYDMSLNTMFNPLKMIDLSDRNSNHGNCITIEIAGLYRTFTYASSFF